MSVAGRDGGRLVDHDRGVRHSLARCSTPRPYQRSSRHGQRLQRDDRRTLPHSTPRRLTAEATIDSLGQVTGIRENFASRFEFGAWRSRSAAAPPASCRGPGAERGIDGMFRPARGDSN